MRLRLMGIVLLAACAAPASAQTPADVADLVDARAAGGETQLEARGYRFITVNTVRDTKWSFWWNERRRQCVSVATNDGRYSAIESVPAANCDASAAPAAPIRSEERTSGAERIFLSCIGSGSTPATQSSSGYSYDSKTRKYEPEYATTLGREAYSGDLTIEISGGLGRIRPSGKLVSPIHSGGVDGWWPIMGLMITPDRITGEYRMNGMNKPHIDYDRRTRVIHIRAATDFTGRCEQQ